MKFGEVSRLCRSDLVFSSTYVKAVIKKIKTNIIGEECGFTSQFSSKICPLKQLKYHLVLSNISENSDEFIFRGLTRGKKSGVCTKQTNK